MNDFIKKLQVLARSETAILKINLQTVARQIILYAVGIVLILLAVAMFNLAIYMGIAEDHGEVTGALIVCAINSILAVVIVMVAGRTKPGPEAAMAREIRELALTEIHSDVGRIEQDLVDFKSDIQRIRSGFSGLMGGGGGSSFSLLNLVPLLDILISALSKSKSKKD